VTHFMLRSHQWQLDWLGQPGVPAHVMNDPDGRFASRIDVCSLKKLAVQVCMVGYKFPLHGAQFSFGIRVARAARARTAVGCGRSAGEYVKVAV
jgi:hypothetical protein